MTSQIRSRIEYLIPTILYTQIWFRNLALSAGFQYASMIIQKRLTFCWVTFVYSKHRNSEYLVRWPRIRRLCDRGLWSTRK